MALRGDLFLTYCTKFILLVFAAVLVPGISGCHKKGSAEGAGISGPVKEQTAETSASGDSKRKLVFGSLKNKNNKGSEKKNVSPVTDLAPGDYPVMLVSLPSSDIFPSDMIIGELQNPHSRNQDRRELSEGVRKFFAEAFQGKINESMLSSSSGEVISRILTKAALKGSVSVRVGKIVFKDDYSEIPVRLISAEGRTEGTVTAEKEGDQWFIDGLSIDFNRLKEKYVPAEEKYEPDSYMNLRLEY